MREPLFVEFVDECLRVVDPQPSDITDEQVSLFHSFARYKNRVECSSEWLFLSGFADPGCLSRIRIRIKEFFLLVSSLTYDPGCLSRIPDPDHLDIGLKKKTKFIGIHVDSVFESLEY